MSLDTAVSVWVHAHQIPLLRAWMAGVSSVTTHKQDCLWAGLLALGWIAYRRYTRGAILFFGTALSVLLVDLLKGFFARVRPPFSSILDSYSFPSAHALTGTVFFGLAAWTFGQSFPSRRKAFYGTAAVLALWVGVSRIYVEVHWLSDVLAGFLIGFVFIRVWLWVFRKAGFLRAG